MIAQRDANYKLNSCIVVGTNVEPLVVSKGASK